MKFFKPEDYACLFPEKSYDARFKNAAALCEIANEKLEKEVHRIQLQPGVNQVFFHSPGLKLVEVYEEECQHEPNFLVFARITNDGPAYLKANCRNCGINFKLQELKDD